MATESDTYDIDYYNEEDVREKTAKKIGKRRYYPSNRPQSLIRNAQTGIAYPYAVGSVDQCRLYKIVDATGTCNSDGFVIKGDLPNPNPNHLFYDNPEQCMSHLRVSIQTDDIARWRERAQKYN